MLRARGVEVDDSRHRSLGGAIPARSQPWTWRSSPTCPTPHRSWPPPRSPAAGHGPALAGGRPSQPGVLAARDPASSSAPTYVRGRRLPHGARAPTSCDGVDLDLRDASELTPVVAAMAALAADDQPHPRRRPHPRPRDRPARRPAGRAGDRWARRSHQYPRRPGHPPAAAGRRRLADLRRPSDGPGRRAARAGGAGRRSSTTWPAPTRRMPDVRARCGQRCSPTRRTSPLPDAADRLRAS